MGKMFQYNPDPEIWDGYVEVEVPDYATRVSLRAEFAKLDGDTEKLTAKVRELAHGHVKGVALKHKASGVAVESLEYLEDYEEAEGVFSSVGLCVAKGPKLGNVLAMP
jgi:hypothetical protein